ncbi:6-phosphogluconate dehydrogenase-like protein [Aspergillus heteromorphus CBS 117.55]|uniref:6-phosphogluconate dehydrogenase-like protein n=1 Tax=Aspergillus heteromorphus CBS 117.55 TaxID=1448321 RepID=A0A317V537_9EURO|nr:6-phosphogluconate dehydrogenase-like protein [Aspergillus heteromorphus CBS 117.55]PWY67952.1 6-phosphogluconate dehydrogenase-like protein [Aspergillus heteromorphus CBS 117.55]
MSPRLAFIGLGRMGLGISENILHHGDIDKPLVLYNRTMEKALDHSRRLGDCQVAESIPAAVSAADIVWLCLQDQEAVEEAFDQILTTDLHGKLFVDSSTTTPDTANSIARRVCDAGGEFVAAPVMGGPPMALTRSLICIASGPAGSVDRVRPYLNGVMCRKVVDLSGEDPGRGLLLKLMGNFLIMATMETVAEAHVFAEKSGIGIDNMNRLMSAVFPDPPHALYSRQMLTGEYHSGTPLVEVSKALTLMDEVLDLAHQCGASIKIYETAREHMQAAQELGGPNTDIAGVYGAVRVESGLPFWNTPE